MGENFNWTCPYCGRHTTITDERLSIETHRFDKGSKYGRQGLTTIAIVCPNDECKELVLRASLAPYKMTNVGARDGEVTESWSLRPQAEVKVFPDYVPAPILSDYREACLVCDLSPKASATLARRCLQGMIRDFWGVSKTRLIDEIEALKPNVDATSWKAIDAVRKIGNIGAHMAQDINLVADVDPGEAALLIELIETLLTEWYVNRYEREQRMGRVVQVAAAKAPAPPKAGGAA